ncbi:hypothetical protein PI125_g21432 [Phytophthora idaei]|nr:hypothetical protein PI125_g21432 [Phytophthora idaei]
MVMLSSGETSAPCGQGCQLRRGEDADNYDDRGIQWTTTETTDKILPSTHQYAAVACGEHMADSVWRSTASAQPFSTSRTWWRHARLVPLSEPTDGLVGQEDQPTENPVDTPGQLRNLPDEPQVRRGVEGLEGVPGQGHCS